MAKQCNLIFTVLDVNIPLTYKKIIGIRTNKESPNIVLRKKDKGGISITSTQLLTNLDNKVNRDFYALSTVTITYSFLGIPGRNERVQDRRS